MDKDNLDVLKLLVGKVVKSVKIGFHNDIILTTDEGSISIGFNQWADPVEWIIDKENE